MHKGNNKNSFAQGSKPINAQSCALCRPTDPEVTSILDGLLQKFIIKKTEWSSERPSDKEDKYDFIDFPRLLNTIFKKKYNHFKGTTSCPHAELKSQFCKKLQCSLKQLDIMSDRLAWKKAKYNYHLDVLNLQIRSFPRLFQTKNSKLNLKKLEKPSIQKTKKVGEKLTRKSIGKSKQKGNKKTAKKQKLKEVKEIAIEEKYDEKIEEKINQIKIEEEKINNLSNPILPTFAENMPYPSSTSDLNKEQEANFNMNYMGFMNPNNFVWGYPPQAPPNSQTNFQPNYQMMGNFYGFNNHQNFNA